MTDHPKVNTTTLHRWLGIHRHWDQDDLHLISSHNRKLWERLKKKNGWGDSVGISGVPGGLDCVREMLDGGYSITDVAATFGMSRERIRQIANRELGFTSNNSLVRFWDDDMNIFRAYTPEELPIAVGKDAHLANLKRKARRRRKIKNKRRSMLKAGLTALADMLGRQPTVLETSRLVFPDSQKNGATVRLTRWYTLERSHHDRSYTRDLDWIYRNAGMDRKPLNGGKAGRRALTPTQVRSIRNSSDPRSLAGEYGVCVSTIYNVTSGRFYKDILP